MGTGHLCYDVDVVQRILFMEERSPDVEETVPPEYVDQIVDLHRVSRSFCELARESEPSEQTIRNWLKQADLDAGHRSDGLTTEEREELRRLRREKRTLKLKREILKKAAA